MLSLGLRDDANNVQNHATQTNAASKFIFNSVSPWKLGSHEDEGNAMSTEANSTKIHVTWLAVHFAMVPGNGPIRPFSCIQMQGDPPHVEYECSCAKTSNYYCFTETKKGKQIKFTFRQMFYSGKPLTICMASSSRSM